MSAFRYCRTERCSHGHSSGAELIFGSADIQLRRAAVRGIVQLLSGNCDTGGRSGIDSSHGHYVDIDDGGVAPQPYPMVPG